MRHRLNCEFRRFLADRQDTTQKFRTEEDGNLSIAALFIIPMMLIVGGMAVDFMRFESERAIIQDTADRAALAAANLEFTNPGEGVEKVRDFFEKANLDQYLDGDAIITETINNRTVEVNVHRPMNTFFLKLAGIDELDASARSVATQGVGNVEISLVLDISGSMGNPTYDASGNATGQTKIEALRTAATTFIETALQDSNTDRVSISLVPYSQHVNAGPDLFDNMNVNQVHNLSHCVEFDDADYSVAGISANSAYEQGQHIDPWSRNSVVTTTTCPSQPFERITAISQDKDALLGQVAQMQPTTQTSIFLGMKWGLALLDPSARSLVSGNVDSVFANRPGDYVSAAAEAATTKVIVVMTDGQNTPGYYVQDEFYDEPSEVAQWAENPVQYWFNNNVHSGYHSLWDFIETRNPTSKGDQLLAASCDAAREKNVQVFAVAFEAPEAGERVMSDCATTTNHYFNTNGDDLNAVFRAIAEQVTDLRLTQ